MISLLTALMIRNNETRIIEKNERIEAWTYRDGYPHALVLSAPLDKKEEFKAVIEELNVISDTELFGTPDESGDDTDE